MQTSWRLVLVMEQVKVEDEREACVESDMTSKYQSETPPSIFDTSTNANPQLLRYRDTEVEIASHKAKLVIQTQRLSSLQRVSNLGLQIERRPYRSLDEQRVSCTVIGYNSENNDWRALEAPLPSTPAPAPCLCDVQPPSPRVPQSRLVSSTRSTTFMCAYLYHPTP